MKKYIKPQVECQTIINGGILCGSQKGLGVMNGENVPGEQINGAIDLH